MTTQPEALRLADEWLRKTRSEADRRSSAYDHYGMGNTPENVDPLGAKMVAELRRLHLENERLQERRDALLLECIDIVALHGGSVEIEAAIRAKMGEANEQDYD